MRFRLTPLEREIFNDGERLIPGITHELVELVRHRSSYAFFSRIIRHDVSRSTRRAGRISIVDLGCGVGHGCELLARIPGAQVLGVDISTPTIGYARRHYARRNISYEAVDLTQFIPRMDECDYVVSRNVLEHIPGGLVLAKNARFRRRLMIDVPYDEPADRNRHHALHELREDAFADFQGAELFYQDINGAVYDSTQKPSHPNVIACVVTRGDLPRVCGSGLGFPTAAWKPSAYLLLQDKVMKAACLASRIKHRLVD